jgi:hypothetical protein
MAFVVKFHDGDSGTPYEDEDAYQFLHDGVLKVTKKADNTTTYYGPGTWHSVGTKNDQKPEPTLRLPVKLPHLPRG